LIAVSLLIWLPTGNETHGTGGPAVAANEDGAGPSLDDVLAIGVTDHIQCAVTYYKGKAPHYSDAEMREELGPDYAALLHIVRYSNPDAEVVVAHQCSFEGRQYVHMVLHRGDDMLSYILTRKRPGEAFPVEADPAASVDDHNLYAGKVEGYTLTGFETENFFVFLASELDARTNISIVSALLRGTVDLLDHVSV
jgi:hypothetical protein